MKRGFLTLFIILLLSSPLPVAAMMTQTKLANNNQDSVEQTVYGYIDEVFELVISNPIYSGDGFNLNVNDGSNPYRAMIAPTPIALVEPGLKIGNFSVITSQTDISLKITHTPLVLHRQNQAGGADESVWVDWELGVVWEKAGNVQIAMCLSSNWDTESAVPHNIRSISIPITENTNLVDTGMYFRLTQSSPVSVSGKYLASVIFEVEGQ